jgi:hypothetical protein
MKTCIKCGETNQWVSPCECGENICDQCYPMHERYCSPRPVSEMTFQLRKLLSKVSDKTQKVKLENANLLYNLK